MEDYNMTYEKEEMLGNSQKNNPRLNKSLIKIWLTKDELTLLKEFCVGSYKKDIQSLLISIEDRGDIIWR